MWHKCHRQARFSLVAWGVPTRPKQTSPDRLLRWQERRKRVGSRIREIRLGQGLTQEALGLEAGMDRRTIIRIEWGEISIAYERLWEIADVLGVDVADLFLLPSTPPAIEPHRRGRARSSTRTRLSVDPEEQA
ncbi:helix-turn-helix transcriptional regulator [Pseudarthrobacter sp. N5]|uniref:helix-turn-helix transcriptional regulator n=1 Tax=Pseudarthrobacter sp. N5 TaxID=3418416 RepID=UPI003CF38294